VSIWKQIFFSWTQDADEIGAYMSCTNQVKPGHKKTSKHTTLVTALIHARRRPLLADTRHTPSRPPPNRYIATHAARNAGSSEF
jgi:hypothetical protein